MADLQLFLLGNDMDWWTTLPVFWKGFICGGISVPVAIVCIEILVKFVILGKKAGR